MKEYNKKLNYSKTNYIQDYFVLLPLMISNFKKQTFFFTNTNKNKKKVCNKKKKKTSNAKPYSTTNNAVVSINAYYRFYYCLIVEVFLYM